MTPTLFSLISLTLGFAGLLVWVLRPANQQRWEQASQLPFDSDELRSTDHE